MGGIPGQFASRSFETFVSGMKQENTSTSSHGQQLFRRRPRQGSHRLFHSDRIDEIPRDKIRKKQKSAVLRYHSQQECGSARTGSRSKSSVLIRRRSEEHTSELQSRPHLVCRLLLEKKK